MMEYVHRKGHIPVVNFVAGGVATPSDAMLMMQLGAEGGFAGSGIKLRTGTLGKFRVVCYNRPKDISC